MSRPIIVGAGIAGLTLSLALARLGRPSLILEARPESSTDGAGIQLGPNATVILDQLGVLDAVAKQAGRPVSIVVRGISDGRTIARLPLPSSGAGTDRTPYLVAHRSALHGALLDAATLNSAIEFRYNCRLHEYQQNASQVTAVATDGFSATGQALIGCDGLWSKVREIIAPEYQLAFSGMVAARAVVPIERAPEILRDRNTGVWLGPDAHIVKYPIDAGQSIALVVVTRHAQRLIGWGHDIAREELLKKLPKAEPNLSALLESATSWRQWALFDPPPLTKWAKGRTIVIGDAAHPVLPFLAQGGAMAVEDAFVLANLLAQHDPSKAFPLFEQQRRNRVQRVQAASRRNGQIYHLSGITAALRNATMQWLPARHLMRRYDWIYDWRPSQISQTS